MLGALPPTPLQGKWTISRGFVATPHASAANFPFRFAPRIRHVAEMQRGLHLNLYLEGQILYYSSMKKFKYTEDVQRWLEPMTYDEFWYVITPYNLVLQPRDHCDQQIRDRLVDEEDVLAVLKIMAEEELAERLGLKRKPVTPWLKLVE